MNAQFDPETRKDIAKAVAITALSALATGLVKWALDTIQERTKRKDKADGE